MEEPERARSLHGSANGALTGLGVIALMETVGLVLTPLAEGSGCRRRGRAPVRRHRAGLSGVADTAAIHRETSLSPLSPAW